MCLIPENLKYTATHEWVEELEDGRVKIGLTDYAQKELSDIVYVNLPEVEDEFEAGSEMADVESVKAVSTIYCPVSGKVAEINEELYDAPEKVNEAPYDAWLVILEDVSMTDGLLDNYEYAKVIEEEKD